MENYPRRPGSDDSGRDYEIRISALLSLRCATMKNIKKMWMASNVDQVGDFDDIVLYTQNLNGDSVVYMIQLKHQEAPKNITEADFLFITKSSLGKKKKWKEDFSLSKYCKGYLSLKKAINDPAENEPEIVQLLRKVDKILFVLFTNKDVNKCKFLSDVLDVNNVEFLNTSVIAKENVYKFDHTPGKLNYDSTFLQELILFTNQSHAKDVDKLIQKEIKNLMGLSKAHIDYKGVVDKFLSFIKIWIKETGISGENEDTKIHLTLTKEDVINAVTDIILEPYNINFAKDFVISCNSPHQLIWDELLVDKTITVVDSDDTVVTYLKQYIGNKVDCYSSGKTWIEDLSKKARDLFYNEQNELKLQILKMIGNNRNINVIDVYKCLWFNNKVSLLLEIDNEEHFKIIRKILKLFQYKLKVIVINRSKDCLVNITDVPKQFATIKNLKNEDRVRILNLSIKLQGRSSISLGNLIDKSMYEHIKCKDIIHVLVGDYNIGNVYEPLDECFIQRSLSKVIFETKMLKQVQDFFVIHNSGGKLGFLALVDCDVKYIDLSNENNIVLTEDNNLKLESVKHPVHRLHCCYKDYLEWKESLGSTSIIRHHQVIEPKSLNHHLTVNKAWKFPQDIKDFWIDLNDLIKNDFYKTTYVINACPGMGKSVLLNFIALYAPANVWIIKINLTEHYDYYEKLRRNSNLNSLDHLNYFNDVIIKKYGCDNIKLTKAVIEKLLKQKDIFILLDGFDEIAISYKHEVTEIAKALYNECFAIWITTRPVMKKYLEDTFDVISNTIKPFCLDDQKKFLIKYFGGGSSNETDLNIIKEFVDKLLEAARANLKVRDCEFTGIPLQTKLLAEAFKNDCAISLTTGTIQFHDKFDLLYLYEKFIDDKNDILCCKFGIGMKEMRMFFEKHHQLFALKTLFFEDDLCDLNLDDQLCEYYEDKQHKIQFLQREGVIVVEQNETGTTQKFDVNFVHRTFAEYLAARWLAENFKSKNKAIIKTIPKLLEAKFEHYEYGFLFNVFDRLIAKNAPLHLAIMKGQIEEATSLIKSNPEIISQVDEGGRNAVHVMAQYGIHHREDSVDNIKEQDDVANLIELIPSDQITNTRDDLLDYGPLDYAIASRSYAVANKLCEKSEILDFHVDINVKDEIFAYCNNFKYKYLFKLVLPYFASRDLLLEYVDPDVTLESYCALESDESDNRNICEYAKERGRGATNLLEMFQSKPDYYNDLQFAAAFGTEDNVLALLSEDIDVNEDDVHNNMPLHYAAIHGRTEIVKLLLSKGAELDALGDRDKTPIHYAAEKGHIDILNELLSRGVDINQQSGELDTPLHLALMNYHVDTAKFLLANGAVGHIQNDLKDTPLSCAAELGYVDIVSELLKSDSCRRIINMQYEIGKALLHFALVGPRNYDDMDLENQKCMVRLLLDNDVDVNLQDDFGDTELHYSSNYNVNHPKGNDDLKCFYEDIVVLLLSKGTDPNIKNNAGKTALDLAIEGGNTKTVSVLEKLTCV